MRMFILLLLPASLPAQKTTLLVLNKAASTLAFYTPSGKLLDTVPVGEHPHEMVYDGRYVYTTDNGTMQIEEAGTGGNTVSIVDVEARKKTGDIPLGKFHRPHGIAIDRRTGLLAISCELPDRLLTAATQPRPMLLRDYDTRGKTSHMVTLGLGSRWAYVSNSSSNTISAVDLATRDVVMIPVAERPEGTVLSRDGRLLYVANREGARISIIDTEKKAVIGEIATGRGPVRVALTPNGRSLVYACLHDHVVETADPVTRKVTGRVRLDGSPVSLSLAHDGRHAYSSVQEKDTVYVIALTGRLRIVRRIHTPPGSGPDATLEISAPR